MQEDLEYCLKWFNDFVVLLDNAIQNKSLSPNALSLADSIPHLISVDLKKTIFRALKEQEEGGENHENPTNASAH